MILGYVIAAVIVINTIYEVEKVIISKKYTDLLILLLFIPFLVFLFSTMILGGSAFNNASTDYELYQADHYYLCSHGNYTEVTCGTFLYAKISEVIGIISFGVVFVISIVKNANNRSNKRQMYQ